MDAAISAALGVSDRGADAMAMAAAAAKNAVLNQFQVSSMVRAILCRGVGVYSGYSSAILTKC